MVLISLYKRLSSANSLMKVLGDILSEISLIYIKKNNGPRTVPWGTPERTGLHSDAKPSTTTLWVLPKRKDLDHDSSEFGIPN